MSEYKIKHNGNEFDASPFQEEIFKFIQNGVGNLVVNAAAGASKTTTLVNCIEYIKPGKTVLCVSFNKHIAEELKRKITNPLADARTCSSIGFQILRENGIAKGENCVDDEKYGNYIRNNINNLTLYGETKKLGPNRPVYMRNIYQLVDLCRYTLAFTNKEIEKLANKYGIVPVRDEFNVVRNVLIWGKTNVDIIDQTDMVWLPNVLNLNTKYLLKDYVFIDEAQDITIAQQQLILKCFKRNTRFVAVGDRNQQINVWCGSDEAAIENFKAMPNTIELKLPVCYRCGYKIVDYAKSFSDDIVAAPDAEPGSVNYGVTINDIRAGDMVLCRITYPLIELQQEFFKRNRNSYIQGAAEIKKDYLNLIENTGSKNIDRSCMTKDGLFPRLYVALFNEIERLMQSFNMDEEEAITRASVLYMYDNIEALKVLSAGLQTVDELKEKIQIVLNEKIDNAILLSTIHKAKGLESDNVFIYCPSMLTKNRFAKKDWELKTERNLEYVAYTRAKKSLNFIKENGKKYYDNPYNGKKLKIEFDRIKEKLNYTYKVNDCEILENELPSIVKNVQPKVENSQNKKKGGLKFWNLM